MSENSVPVGKILKVWSVDRKVRKGVVSDSYEDLTIQCRQKFNIEDDIVVRFVLNDDGTEVDEKFYTALMTGTVLVILANNEQWQDINDNAGTSSSTTCTINNNKESEEIAKLVENIRKKSSSLKRNPQHSTIRLTIGWLNYSYKDAKYKQVRSSKGEKSSTDNVVLRDDATYDDILEKATKIYFPKGKSKLGRKEKMDLLLGTVKGEVIDREGFSLHSCVQKIQTQQKRIYLLSKAQYTLSSISTDEDSDFDSLPDINFSKRPRLSTDVSNQLNTFSYQDFLHNDDEVTPLQQNPTPSQPAAHQQVEEAFQRATPSQPAAPQQAEVFQQATPSQPAAPQQAEVFQQATPSQPATPLQPATSSQAAVSLQLNAGTPNVSFNVTTCCICYDRDRNTALIPCGHVFCCVCALAQIHSGNRKCPLCRQYIVNTLELVN